MGKDKTMYKATNGNEEYEILMSNGDMCLIESQPNIYEIVRVRAGDNAVCERGVVFENYSQSEVIAAFLKWTTHKELFNDIGRDLFNLIPYRKQFESVLFLEDERFNKAPTSVIDEIYDNFIDGPMTGLIDVPELTKGINIDKILQTQSPRVFVDMDGTLAKFTVTPEERLMERGYFLNLQPNWDLLNNVKQLAKEDNGIEVYIISAVLMDSDYAEDEKKQWLDIYLPEIPEENRIFTPCKSGINKADYVPGEIWATDVLIDDYSKNLFQWKKSGGTGLKAVTDMNNSTGTWIADSGAHFNFKCSYEEFKKAVEAAAGLQKKVSLGLE